MLIKCFKWPLIINRKPLQMWSSVRSLRLTLLSVNPDEGLGSFPALSSAYFIESQNGEVGRDPCRSSTPALLPKQGPLERITQDNVQVALNTYREGDSTSTGNLRQCSVTLRVKKLFLQLTWNLVAPRYTNTSSLGKQTKD